MSTGRLANNTNLGAKGVIAIRAFGELCGLLTAAATKATNAAAPTIATTVDGCSGYTDFVAIASNYSATWMALAKANTTSSNGSLPHYKMSFNDVPTVTDSWSLKYNLLWQRMAQLDGPFPQSVFAQEAAWYE